jgi:hypothetical protein
MRETCYSGQEGAPVAMTENIAKLTEDAARRPWRGEQLLGKATCRAARVRSPARGPTVARAGVQLRHRAVGLPRVLQHMGRFKHPSEAAQWLYTTALRKI